MQTHLHTLPNGVRLLLQHAPEAATASASVYIRAGSVHEGRSANGIGHVLEHMVFKGTAQRSCRQINLDAERLGAEVNAHTDKDHMALHMRGLAADAPAFLRMLAELVAEPAFPADELERERQVILQEWAEDDDDPLSNAFKAFDRASFGLHPAAQPVIGTRANIQRFSRDELLAHARTHFHGGNLVVALAGALPPDDFFRAAEAAFGALPPGQAQVPAAPAWQGGVRAKPMAGCSQAHLVLGFALPAMACPGAASGLLAAALFGEGMSSPLLDELREQRGLAYYANCSADLLDMCGQFVVEASLAPEHLDEALALVARLLRAQAEQVAPAELDRARRQLLVRRLRDQERPGRRLEAAALELLLRGQVRSQAQWQDELHAVDPATLRERFATMLAGGVACALAGKLPRGAGQRSQQTLAQHLA
jgi:predicted Zn-dependent peptidase